MAILPLVIAPDDRLKQKSAPVDVVDDAIRTLLNDMLDTMYHSRGIGLAAVQVGIHKRLIVVDIEQGERGEPVRPLKLVNAHIIHNAEEINSYKEGCLSFPEQYSDVERPEKVTVRYQDETGAQKELVADGLLATCLQHEIDHTDGIVFVDHISRVKKDMILKKLEKAKKLGHIHDHSHCGHDHHHEA